MTRAIRLAIVHRNRLFRECLASVLSDGKRFRLTDVDQTDPNYLKSMQEQDPDVILIDLGLPEQLAVGLTQHIREGVPRAKMILLAPDAEDRLVECLAAGAHGCVLEESSLQELQTAIEKVVGGEKFYSPEIVPSMCDRLVQVARGVSWRERAKSVDLTPRELEVVSLIA